MHNRISKILLVASVGLFLFIVVLNNALLDYASNYQFVEGVLSMNTLFSGESQAWRAFRNPNPGQGYWLYHAFYVSLILWEAAAAALCFAGVVKLVQNLNGSAAHFNAAKKLAVYGLTLSLLQWFGAFITVGGEWFLMWQSSKWNGQDAAFRMFACLGIILIFLSFKDEELAET
jgi:predicted small integral membrane protein